MSSEPMVYVDSTLVAHAVAKEFHEAAKGHSRDGKVEFFGNERSFSCLVRAVTRRVANKPMIQIGKKSEIRRKVKQFLQFLQDNKILENPSRGRNSGKWVFVPARMDAVEVISGDDVRDFASADLASRPSRRRAKVAKRHKREGRKKDRVPYVNDSSLHSPVAPKPSLGLV